MIKSNLVFLYHVVDMPPPKKPINYNQDRDKRTPISVIRDELKIMKSQVPAQNIILSPLIRNIPTDISGFLDDAELGHIISIMSSISADLYIPFNKDNTYINGTTFRIVNVGNYVIKIYLGYGSGPGSGTGVAQTIVSIGQGESVTLVYYSAVPCWIKIPGLANFINFTNY
jgi:hypothetical protein